MGEKNFMPLEGNPEVFQSYAEALGRHDLLFQDLYAFEQWAFDMLSKPIVGLIAIVPLTETISTWRRKNYPNDKKHEVPPEVWFTRQRISNTCGTIALLHLLNNVNVATGSDVSSTLEKMKDKAIVSPQDRAAFIESSDEINDLHAKFQSKGDTAVASRGAPVDTHFITFVVVRDTLYELDGQLCYPVNHGPATQEELLMKAIDVISTNFIKLEPNDMRFSAIAVSSKVSNEE
ncbi:peptidase C12 [Babesia gibsoni]|uniref:Ubiquitin carboxyl-terminal hydrolase n=1 Tax=Babesia gibsoni TaxID=33632 RepID=A0AAD8PEN0_BABGI|nr:peptidase C12 [Babesia gibsoni]